MPPVSHSIEFFEQQFRRQIAAGDFALNPFETLALPWLHGRVLDLGCGLGNLALAAARQGATVTAVDASASAVASLEARAAEQGVAIRARVADLRHWQPDETFDAIACIGLLMFFKREIAVRLLRAIANAVAPGGVAIVNVLVEGTTYMGMFEPGGYYLFKPSEVVAPFASWKPLETRFDEFPAPGGLVKRFTTLVTRRPASA